MAACETCGARHWIIVGDKPLGMVDMRAVGRVMAYEIEARCKACGRQEFWDQVRPWESNRLSKFYEREADSLEALVGAEARFKEED
jgi:hypothetical protein